MSEHEAGRDLGALIETRIFGNAVDHEFDEPMVKARRDQYDEWGFLPAYSTDIAAAWQVVERLAALGWETSLTRWTDSRPRCSCYLERNDADGVFLEDRQTEAPVDAMPLAICRAALAAVGVVSK